MSAMIISVLGILLALEAAPTAETAAAEKYEERIVGYKLHIGSDGRVKKCRVTYSSGDSKIDAAACKVLIARARFQPARDNYGNAVEDTYSGKLKWRVEHNDLHQRD